MMSTSLLDDDESSSDDDLEELSFSVSVCLFFILLYSSLFQLYKSNRSKIEICCPLFEFEFFCELFFHLPNENPNPKAPITNRKKYSDSIMNLRGSCKYFSIQYYLVFLCEPAIGFRILV